MNSGGQGGNRIFSTPGSYPRSPTLPVQANVRRRHRIRAARPRGPASGPDRQVPGHPQARRRRDERGLPLPGPVPRPRRRGQDASSPSAERPGSAGGCSASCSSPRRRSPASSRTRTSRRSTTLASARDRATSSWSTSPAARWSASARRRTCCRSSKIGRDHLQVHARARLRAQARASPTATSSPATSCYAGAPTDVQHRRLRPRRMKLGAETTQITGIGSPAYMSPRADQGAAGRPPHRPLFARRGDVPAAHRHAAVPRRQQVQHDLPDHDSRTRRRPRRTARRCRRRSTASCAGRCRRTSTRPLPELGRVLAGAGRGVPRARARRRRARNSATATSSTRCARWRSSPSSPTPSCGRCCVSAPGRTPAPGTALVREGEPGRLLLHARLGRGEGHQEQEAAEHARRRASASARWPTSRARRTSAAPTCRARRLARHHASACTTSPMPRTPAGTASTARSWRSWSSG